MSKPALSPINPSGLPLPQSPPTLRTPTSTQSRYSSFLPIPTPNKTSFSINSTKTVPTSHSQSSLSLAYDRSALKPTNSNTSNVTASPLPAFSQAKTRESSARNGRLPGTQVPPQTSLNSNPTTSKNVPQKSTQLLLAPGVSRKPTDDQAGKPSDTRTTVPMPHSLRRIPRLPRQNILSNSRTHLLSTAEPSTTRRSTRSNATPSPFIHQQPNPTVNRGLTPPHQARKAKSQREFNPKSRPPPTKIFSAQFTTPIKQSSTHSESDSTSPESLQSKITLTDGDSSIRTRFDYAPQPKSSGFSQFDSIRKIASSSSSNVVRRAADVMIPPPNSDNLPPTLDYRVPVESQPRLTILEKIKSAIIGDESYDTLLNFQAVYRLVCQSDLYETPQHIEKRIFENSILFIPQATLEIPTQFTPTLNSCLATTTPFILATQSTGYGTGPSVKKLHVGAIILEKLRRVSKNGPGQSLKHGPSKSISKTSKVSSLPLSHNSNKVKNTTNSTLFDKTPNTDHHRFSQILGAGLEFMNHSMCVVTMGERLHLLPTLPFSVIEEIYRRGMRTPGILRISGDFTRIDELVKMFEACPSSGIDLSSEDIHTLCGLLKYYLRSLPEPLFHPLLSEIFWRLCVKPDRNKNKGLEKGTTRVSEFMMARYLLQLIPTRSLSLLAYVIPFLAHVPTFSENRIQDESLATMLGPAIFVSRDIGLPGLGLHPRPGKMGQPATRLGGGIDPSTPNPSQSEKNEASERAAESTLWMMNHWKLVFSEVYNVGETKAEEVDSIETHNALSPPRDETFQDDGHMFTGKFIRSRPTSFLTYSSGLTGSRRSTMIEESNQSSSRIQSPTDSDDLDFVTPQDIDQSDPRKDPKTTHIRSSTAVEFPFPDSNEADSNEIKRSIELDNKSPIKKEGKDQKLRQSHLSLFKHTSQEEEQRERRNSEKLTKLLSEYIEGREEKIIQQEMIIENLIYEIGRLKTAEEEEEIDRRKSLLDRIKLSSTITSSSSTTTTAPPIASISNNNNQRNSSEQPLKKIKDFLNSIDQQNSNVSLNIAESSNDPDSQDNLHGRKESSGSSSKDFIQSSNLGLATEGSDWEGPSRPSESPTEDSRGKFEQKESYTNEENPEQTSNFDDSDEEDRNTEHGGGGGEGVILHQVEEQQPGVVHPKFNNSHEFNKDHKQFQITDPFVTTLPNVFDPSSSSSSLNRRQMRMKLEDREEQDTGRFSFDTRRSRSSMDTQRSSVDTPRFSDVKSDYSSFISGEKCNTHKHNKGGTRPRHPDEDLINMDNFHDLTRSLSSKHLSLDTKHLSFMSSNSSFASGETEAFKAEIERLRFINNKLILKLKSIESIIATSHSDILLP